MTTPIGLTMTLTITKTTTMTTIGEIKQKLLRRPSLINGRAAAVRIVSERYKCGPAAARIRLDEFQCTSGITDLFKKTMPAEFKREFKKVGGSRVDVAPRFFSALGFPVYGDHIMSLLEQGEEPGNFSIPIGTLNPHACVDCCGFENLGVIFQLAHLLWRMREADPDLDALQGGFWTHMAHAYNLPETLRPTGTVAFTNFLQTFEPQRSPLKHLPLAIDVIAYSTDCIFFDFNEDEMGDPDLGWNPENIRWLREQFRIARSIEVRMEKLDVWLEAAPRERVARACRLYQKVRKVSDRKQKARVQIASEGRVLVGIL